MITLSSLLLILLTTIIKDKVYSFQGYRIYTNIPAFPIQNAKRSKRTISSSIISSFQQYSRRSNNLYPWYLTHSSSSSTFTNQILGDDTNFHLYNSHFNNDNEDTISDDDTNKVNSISSRINSNTQNSEPQIYYSPNKPLQDINQDDSISILVNDSSSSSSSSSLSSSSINEYSFFDEATILIKAGSGGQGASTYQKGPKRQDGPPDGGNGGMGGNVYLIVDENLNTLAGLNKFALRPNSFGGSGAAYSSTTTTTTTTNTSSSGDKSLNANENNHGTGNVSNLMNNMIQPMSFKAENGNDGNRQFKNGKNGDDLFIKVPPGTVVQEEIDIFQINPISGEKEYIGTNVFDLGTVDKEDTITPTTTTTTTTTLSRRLLVAKGGEGGEGSGTQGYKKGRGVKRPRSPPTGGEKKRLKLTLKIIADVALVGVPNAGKSTFLASVTRAKPKIANYPFTTVIPNLGVWVPQNAFDKADGSASAGLALCDVPGLIEGAANGIGLGHTFLRHVERCHVILHLIDATSNDPIEDYKMLNRELVRYGNGKLGNMPQIVVVNKIDAWEENSGETWEKGLRIRMDKETLESKLREVMPHTRLMWMSAKERDGVDDLMGRTAAFVKKVKEASSNSSN